MKLGSLPAQAVLLATLWLMLCTAGADGDYDNDSHNSNFSGPQNAEFEIVEFDIDDAGPEICDSSDGTTDADATACSSTEELNASISQPQPPAVHTPVRRVLRVTAYCDRGITASGISSGLGQCAAPADIPFGSIIHIPKLNRSFVVTDRTAQRFRGNTVDLFIPSYDRCLRFGRKYLECHITKPLTPANYGSRSLREQARMRA